MSGEDLVTAANNLDFDEAVRLVDEEHVDVESQDKTFVSFLLF